MPPTSTAPSPDSLRARLGFTQEPLYLIDASAFIYRAFYAYPDLKRADGFPTSALYIVLRLIFKLLREERPAYVAFVMDGRGKGFRNELFPDYKANRSATPEDLVKQFGPIREAMEVLGVPVQVRETEVDGEKRGVEADDLIASLAAKFKGERPVVLVGMDKDLKQCLDASVVMWDPVGKAEKVLTLEDFTAETGLTPEVWADYQALIGDSSDNIPGVPGIGPKTASKIMADYPTLEEIKAHLDELPKAQQNKLSEHMDAAFSYRELTRLATDQAEDVVLEDLRVDLAGREAIAAFLEEYELKTLSRELSKTFPEAQSGGKAPKEEKRQAESGQLSLLGDAPAKAEAAGCTAAELPDLTGQAVGFAPVGGEGDEAGTYAIGLPQGEYRCREVGELPARLDKAVRVSLPSYKELLAREPAFETLDPSKILDIGLAAYVLSPEERDYSLSKILDRTPEAHDLQEGGDVHPENPGIASRVLGEVLAEQLDRADLATLLKELEEPLTPVLARMERRGIGIDTKAFASFLDEVTAKLTTLTQEVYEAAGEEFNLRSSQQLAEILFDKLGLSPAGKTPSGAPSTSQAVLEKLAGKHPVLDLILEFRTLEKLRSTYLAPMPKMVGPDGRLHTTFNQTATATGRLSSSNPNLQNIPIRGEFGPRMRGCFRAGPGKLLAGADYSQIELRVLAHFSQDETLLDAFAKNQDIHARTAGLLFDKAAEDVSRDERGNAKTINFGLIYGMGPQRLARELNVSLNEAKGFIERYFERLQGLKTFYENVETTAREQGYVTTLAGRRRFTPEIASRNNQLASQARRQAINTVIQGSAADIIKIAMIVVEGDAELKELGAELILQVHDELLLEVEEANASAAGERLALLMREALTRWEHDIDDLSVPLAVDHGTGKTWDEAH